MKVLRKEKVDVIKQSPLSNNSPTKWNTISNKILLYSTIIFSFVFNTVPVYAIDKIEGGDITIKSLSNIISNLARQIQVFGIILAFIALIVFVIQFIIGDDETKQRKRKTILYTLSGVALLILVPSLINFIIGTLNG